MAKLKLTYFDFDGGRGEPARLALHIGGIAFEEDVRFDIGDVLAPWRDHRLELLTLVVLDSLHDAQGIGPIEPLLGLVRDGIVERQHRTHGGAGVVLDHGCLRHRRGNGVGRVARHQEARQSRSFRVGHVRTPGMAPIARGVRRLSEQRA